MIQTIRVTSKTGDDPRGTDVFEEVQRTLGADGLDAIRTARVYRVEGLSEPEARAFAEALLAESVSHRHTVNAPILTEADHVVEIAYRPGVMNPEAASIRKAATDLGFDPVAVDSSTEYGFFGAVSPDRAKRIVDRLLMNPTIEWLVDEPPETLLLAGTPGETAVVPVRTMNGAQLMDLSERGLYLDLDEMRAIQDHFDTLGRDPTDLELEVLAQTWSEHCKHKTFRSEVEINGERKAPFFTRLKEAARQYSDLVVSAFVDNSGVMRFYDGWALAGKVETHNSPSAIEPYGGAMTGSGGVFRDILGTGQGAAVIASTDMFCLAPPDLPADRIPPGALPPDYLLRKVVAGVRDYGNRMGIPTNNGSVTFHPDFRAKPTVIVGAYGLMPEAKAPKGEPRPGDRILVLGGRTGRDGIHGATFSSTAMTAETVDVNATAVQIGNAVEEKRLLDAILACRDADLIQALTDCGAGGFSSAIGEMGEEVGAEVHLERAPLKYPGLAPWEIFVSESQERMVMAVDPEHVEAVHAICDTFNVEVADLGYFTGHGRLVVQYAGETVGSLDMTFLHDGNPKRVLKGAWSPERGWAEVPPLPQTDKDWRRAILGVLGHPTVASKEPIVRQYDHTVQGTNVVPPYGGPMERAAGDAAVIRPLLDRQHGAVIAHGLNPLLNLQDPYWGGVWAAAEAVSNLTAVGGNFREASLIDNFIWPVPDEESLAQLDMAVDACVDVMHALGIPFISGKDSLSSTYRYPDGGVLKIPPVLCISVFGRIEDADVAITPDFEVPGSAVVLVGARDAEAMGGAIYLDVAGMRGDRPPRVDLGQLPHVLDSVRDGIWSGKIRACHDVSQGGLITAAAEMCLGSGYGVDLAADAFGGRLDVSLFNETAGVFVVEVDDADAADALFGDLPYVVIGTVTEAPRFRLLDDGEVLFDLHLDEMLEAWREPMGRVFH